MTKIMKVLYLIAAGLAGVVIGMSLILLTTEPEATVPEVTIPVGPKVSPEEPKLKVDLDNEYGESNQDEANKPLKQEDPTVHEDLRDETPPGVDQADVDKIEKAKPKGLGKPLPVGGAQNYSCTNHFVRNFSDRAPGTKVGLFVLHYTVSRPGSLNAIRGLFDRPSFGASSHLGLEPTGRCEQWVAWNKKAWTQGAFNSVSDSVEIMAMGTESRSWWLAQPIIKNGILSAIVTDRLHARGIPPRHVNPVGCGVQQAGWTDHEALECGNTHHDVQPNFPYDVLQAQIVKRYNAGQSTALPGPRPKPAWFWDACGEWLGGQFTGLSGLSPKPTWFWQACDQWAKEH